MTIKKVKGWFRIRGGKNGHRDSKEKDPNLHLGLLWYWEIL